MRRGVRVDVPFTAQVAVIEAEKDRQARLEELGLVVVR
jgi:hypothetical protein